MGTENVGCNRSWPMFVRVVSLVHDVAFKVIPPGHCHEERETLFQIDQHHQVISSDGQLATSERTELRGNRIAKEILIPRRLLRKWLVLVLSPEGPRKE